MNRTDYALIAAVLRQAVKDEEAEPALAVRFAEALARRGDPEFRPRQFIERSVPEKRRSELGRISRGAFEPPKEKEPVRIEDDAALFRAVLAVEFPHLVGKVSCALTLRQGARFTIGRIGGTVWIRFGGQALSDPVAAVKAAAPDAEQMALGRTAAKEIVGR